MAKQKDPQDRLVVLDGDPSSVILARHPAARIKLIRARVQRGWSRPEFGRRIGIPRHTVFRVEMGGYNPSLPVMLRWAKELGHSLDVFSPQPKPRTRRPRRPKAGLSAELAAE